ncbi:hypothetical protein [Streptomyces sp. NPDC002845]
MKTKNKDWGLAMRTIVSLISYRISRLWDTVLIAMVPIKQALFPTDGPRSTRFGKRAGLHIVALASALFTRPTKREVSQQ